jgi:hypothetical protein
MRKVLRTAIAFTLLTGALPASADVLPFTGTVTGVSNLVGTDPSCAPLPFRSSISPSSTVGYSSLGNFTLSTSTCIALGGGTSNGTFTINFGADSFSGTFDGGSTPTSTAGISDTAWLYTILSGTGRFEGATGFLEAAGLADARTRPTHVAISFIGNINAPAVPEPASWALMLLGFGAIGAVLRRSPRRTMIQIA